VPERVLINHLVFILVFKALDWFCFLPAPSSVKTRMAYIVVHSQYLLDLCGYRLCVPSFDLSMYSLAALPICTSPRLSSTPRSCHLPPPLPVPSLPVSSLLRRCLPWGKRFG